MTKVFGVDEDAGGGTAVANAPAPRQNVNVFGVPEPKEPSNVVSVPNSAYDSAKQLAATQINTTRTQPPTLAIQNMLKENIPVETIYSYARSKNAAPEDYEPIANEVARRTAHADTLSNAANNTNLPSHTSLRDEHGNKIPLQIQEAGWLAKKGYAHLTPEEKDRFHRLMTIGTSESGPIPGAIGPEDKSGLVGTNAQQFAKAGLGSFERIAGPIAYDPDVREAHEELLQTNAANYPTSTVVSRLGGAVADPILRGAGAVGKAVEGSSLLKVIPAATPTRVAGTLQNAFISNAAIGGGVELYDQIKSGKVDFDQLMQETLKQGVQGAAFHAALASGIKAYGALRAKSAAVNALMKQGVSPSTAMRLIDEQATVPGAKGSPESLDAELQAHQQSQPTAPNVFGVHEPIPFGGPQNAAERAAAPVAGKEVGAGAANIEDPAFSNTPAEQNPEATGVKNAMSVEDRKRFGLPDRESPEGKDFDSVYNAGKEKADADPQAATKLLDELRAKPNRPLNDEEVGLLLKHKVDLEKEFQRLNKEVGDAYAAGDSVHEDAARAQLDTHRQIIEDFTSLVEQAGTATARGLNARRMMSAMDYSLSHMTAAAEAAKGSKLTDSELKNIADLHEQLQKHQHEIDIADEENTQVEAKRRADEVIEDLKKRAVIDQKSAPIEPHIKSLADRIIAKLDKASNDALARIRARGIKVNAFGDPQNLADMTIVALAELAKGITKGVDFVAKMVSHFGEEIRPFLPKIRADAEMMLDKSVDQATGSAAPKVKAALKANAKPEDILDLMRERVKSGDKLDAMQGYVRKLAYEIIRGGVKDREPLLDALHTEVKKIDPSITREKVRDILSGYGQGKLVDMSDPVKVQLRDVQQQSQKVAQLEALNKGQAPKRTGFGRQSPSDETRRLTKEVNEGKRKLGIKTTDPATQLKSTLESMKTRTRNTIKDLQTEIDTGQRIVQGKTTPISDAELDVLRKQLADVRKAHDEAFGSEMTDEQRLKMATALAKKNLEAWNERLDKARRGQFDAPSKGQKITAPEVESLRAEAKAAKAEYDELNSAAAQGPTVNPRERALLKQISDVEEKLKTGDTATTGQKQGPDTAFTADLKAKRDALNEQLANLRKNDPILQAKAALDAAEKATAEYERKAQVGEFLHKGKTEPPVTPELKAARDARESAKAKYQELRDKDPAYQKAKDESSDRAYQTALARRAAEYQRRITESDLSVKGKKIPTRSPESVKAKVALEKVREEYELFKKKEELKGRTKFQKGADIAVALRRFSVLSGYSVIKKLAAAAASRVVLTPAEQAVGQIMSRVFPRLAALAPREGGGSLKAESEAFKAIFSKIPQTWEKLKTGKSDLERVYGKPEIPDAVPKWLSIFNHIHGAMKEPVRQNEFARSFQIRGEHAVKNGRNIHDPSVLQEIGEAAKKDADRAIFMNDNLFVDKVSRFINSFGEKNKDTGKVPVAGTAVKATANIIFPVKRIPTNIVAETMQYIGGSLFGLSRAAKAYKAGIETLRPEQADAIMRNLKKGTLGAITAATLLGFYGYKQIGGYYQKGEKRDEEDVKPGEMRAFGVDIDKQYLHHPLFEALQFGATMARVATSKLHKKDEDVQGVGSGSLAATIGLMEEVPFVREMADVQGIADSNTRSQALARQATGMVVPQVVSQISRDTDTKDAAGEPIKRKPDGLKQNFEMTIPGLRQNVPVNDKFYHTKAITDATNAYRKSGTEGEKSIKAAGLDEKDVKLVRERARYKNDDAYSFHKAPLDDAIASYNAMTPGQRKEVAGRLFVAGAGVYADRTFEQLIREKIVKSELTPQEKGERLKALK